MENWWTELISAVNDGALDEVKRIISSHDLYHLEEWPSNGVNCSASDLLCKTIKKHTAIAEELLKCGIPVNEPSKIDIASPLHMAVWKENMKIVEMLLEKSADIFAKHNSRNPLEVAVGRKNVKMAELLLNRVAHLNSAPNCVKRVYECKPIFSACLKGSHELVEFFLSRSSEIPTNSTEKSKLLNLATRLEKPNLVKLLVKYGADINAEADGTAAIQIAVDSEDLVTAECILEFCPDINRKENMRILHRALKRQYSEVRNTIVDVLLRYGFDIRPEDAVDGELLKSAIKWGRLDIVEALLKYGADVNASCKCLQGSTFLHVAAENRRFEVAQFLIEHGAYVNMIDRNRLLPPIYAAVSNLDVAITKLFLSSGAVIENMYHLLSTAFQIDGMKMVEILLQHDTNFDINAITSNDTTVLLNLIYSPTFHKEYYNDKPWGIFENEDPHKAEMAELCLRRGAIVDLKTANGDAALPAAVSRLLPLVVEKLLEYGAEIDAQYDAYENRTPLMVAVKNGNLSVVQSLINFLPDSEIRDLQGKTALHHAAEIASPSIVQELLDYGADINATSEDNTTPYTCIKKTAGNSAVLGQHIHKMKALNLYVNPKNLERFDLQRNLYDDCKREIKEMKRSKISDSTVSFYDILTKGTPNLVNYVRNKHIKSALRKKVVYEKKFPMYSAMIYRRFVKSIKLEPLLTPGAQSLDALIGFELPYLASIQLLSYLSMKDLKNLRTASAITD